MLDRTAAGLAELQRAGVVVLWRPLPEMNGTWFWWGHDARAGSRAAPAAFRALWTDVFDYLTRVKGLHNLLWVYSAAASWHAGVTDYYPGDQQVDLVGLDCYDDRIEPVVPEDYEQLRALGKPLGLTETGPYETRDGSWDARRVVQSVRRRHPEVGWFLQWHSWREDGRPVRVALVDNRHAGALLADPRVVTRDEVDWR